jgi:hypothetical protein
MRGVRVFAAALLVPIGVAAAEDSVTHYHLAADAANTSSCRDLDAVLARLHIVTVKKGDVEITSAGGIEGRMHKMSEGVYVVTFELSGQRLDVVANLSTVPKTLTVSDRLFGCRWRADPAQ